MESIEDGANYSEHVNSDRLRKRLPPAPSASALAWQPKKVKWLWVKTPYPQANIPLPTKIVKNGWCSYPKMVPLVLTTAKWQTIGHVCRPLSVLSLSMLGMQETCLLAMAKLRKLLETLPKHASNFAGFTLSPPCLQILQYGFGYS